MNRRKTLDFQFSTSQNGGTFRQQILDERDTLPTTPASPVGRRNDLRPRLPNLMTCLVELRPACETCKWNTRPL
jgi:hypothetical protein